MKWLTGLFTSDRLGSWIRHGLTAGGGALVAAGYMSAEQAADLIQALLNILTSPEAIGGIVAIFIGKAASTKNKEGKSNAKSARKR